MEKDSHHAARPSDGVPLSNIAKSVLFAPRKWFVCVEEWLVTRENIISSVVGSYR